MERVRRQVQWRRRFKCKLLAFGPCDTAAAPRSNSAWTLVTEASSTLRPDKVKNFTFSQFTHNHGEYCEYTAVHCNTLS